MELVCPRVRNTLRQSSDVISEELQQPVRVLRTTALDVYNQIKYIASLLIPKGTT